MPHRNDQIIAHAHQIMQIQIEALNGIDARLNDSFADAVRLICETDGRVVVMGMGKSGLIGKKIAATMASTGTSSFFVHPAEAFHGDLGMIHASDTVLLISNSGETEELLRLMPFLQHQRNRIIALCGKIPSTLSQHATVALDVSTPREACDYNLAPTSSTTAALVMGDAIAIVLSRLRNFQPEDFARFHPGGNLGRRLLTRVGDAMRKTALPFLGPEADFLEVVRIITKGRLGLALIMEDAQLAGVITDGDIRRTLERFENPLDLAAKSFMTRSPKTVSADAKIGEAEDMMRALKINTLIVSDVNDSVLGVLQIYDLDFEQQP
jgi:arabinose-5-phosphate isomerase